jgi:chromosome segregation ATPase
LINNVNAFVPSFVDRIIEKVDDIGSEFRETVATLESKANELSRFSTQAVNDIKAFQTEISDSKKLHQGYSQLKSAYKDLHTRYSSLQSTSSDLQTSISQLEEERDDLANEVNERLYEFEELRNWKRAGGQIGELSLEIIRLERMRDHISEEVEDLSQEKMEADESVTDLTDQVEELLERVATLRRPASSNSTIGQSNDSKAGKHSINSLTCRLA